MGWLLSCCRDRLACGLTRATDVLFCAPASVAPVIEAPERQMPKCPLAVAAP